jgi:hypothetical protein
LVGAHGGNHRARGGALVLSMSEKINHGPSPTRFSVSVNLPVSPLLP